MYTCMYIYIYTRTCIKVPPDVYRMLLDIYQDSGQARYLIVCVCVCVRACVCVFIDTSTVHVGARRLLGIYLHTFKHIYR